MHITDYSIIMKLITAINHCNDRSRNRICPARDVLVWTLLLPRYVAPPSGNELRFCTVRMTLQLQKVFFYC